MVTVGSTWLLAILLTISKSLSNSNTIDLSIQIPEADKHGETMRHLVQTNLREIDATMDVDACEIYGWHLAILFN